jgi:Phytanoyl-CoA dioxygenase (PhyH)
MKLDRRTRRNADVHHVTPDDFFGEIVPDLIERHGRVVAEGIDRFEVSPLAIEVGDSAWSFAGVGGELVVTPGVAPEAFVVTLTDLQFSDWAQQALSFNGMRVARELQSRSGGEREISIWDSLSMTLLEGWAVVDDSLEFLDRHGAPLDLEQSFGLDDDPADIAHFLREAGFLHLRGWLDPRDMAAISSEMDAALPLYTHGDGRSWWATTADGELRCVRLQHFVDHSPTTIAILTSAVWEQLRRTMSGPPGSTDQLVQGLAESSGIEALIKPVGVVKGASDVSFHRDCHLGRHSYNCSGTIIGISVTGSSEANGRLRVVAGSHRLAIPVEIAKAEPYLPVVAVATEPGDLTVHLSCTLHEAAPPTTDERRVMYTGMGLAPFPDDLPDGGRALSDLRERVPDILLNATT